jgi:23S rRNA pseudouridine1911/1915/1917 synthase
MGHMQHSTPDNLQVIYEDNHLIVVNKRPGDIVQGDKTGDIPLSEIVKQYIAIKYNKPGAVFLGVVHRLDRPTSGLLVFARTSKALARLNKMFAERETKKTYWAMVKTTPDPLEGRLEHYLLRNPKQNKSYAHSKPVPEAKRAVLNYRTLAQSDHYTLLEIDLETGRHHQIRCQLAAIGSPIKGDLKYGAQRSNPDGSIHLHARYLELVHPVQKELMTFVAPVPEEPLWQSAGV